MIVCYTGRQSAVNISVLGVSYRLVPMEHTLLKPSEFANFKARKHTKALINAGDLEVIDVEELSKDELVIIARKNGFELNGKETVADLVDILSQGESVDEDDVGGEDDVGNADVDNADADTKSDVEHKSKTAAKTKA